MLRSCEVVTPSRVASNACARPGKRLARCSEPARGRRAMDVVERADPIDAQAVDVAVLEQEAVARRQLRDRFLIATRSSSR